MSASGRVAEDLVRVYDHTLEQQILKRGTSLPCRDEKLWMQVEEMLRSRDAWDTHCLGIGTLEVMIESLKAGAAPLGRRGKVRAGLKGLAKAFEFLEQASLNLYLGPWRKEYKVIKTYSGTFTHHITSVLTGPQVETLFGLLGYQRSPSQSDQLLLRSPRVSSASLNEFLRLSCAFFIARCECHLLLAALGSHAGDVQWELSIVSERERGHTLQAALENTVKKLEVKSSILEEEEDLYSEEQLNGAKDLEASPSSYTSTWTNQKSHRGAALSPPLQPENPPSSSVAKGQSKPSRVESERPDSRADTPPAAAGGLESAQQCSCLRAAHPLPKRCFDCDTVHDFTCPKIESCFVKGHKLDYSDDITDKRNHLGEFSSLNGSVGAAAAADIRSITNQHSNLLQPISFHSCCDFVKPDPQVLCHSCNVFHSDTCRDLLNCEKCHSTSTLRVCACGRQCGRNPLVLCRYCGQEYCSSCWYRSPLTCVCGQTFDQSTPV